MPHFGALAGPIISALGAPQAITVTRQAPGGYVAGIWTAGVSELLVLDAAVQPSTPKERQMLPEGEQTREAITVYTVGALRAGDVAAQHTADRLTWAGRVYRVSVVEDWTAQAGYARAVAVREGP